MQHQNCTNAFSVIARNVNTLRYAVGRGFTVSDSDTFPVDYTNTPHCFLMCREQEAVGHFTAVKTV